MGIVRGGQPAQRARAARAARARGRAAEGSILLGDAFAAGLDLDAIEAAGLEPIAPLLREIEGAQDQWAVLALLPTLHRAGIFALFGWGVTVDHDDSDRYLLWLVQAGLGLADRERYFDPSDAAVELRAAYVEHVGAQLAHVGFGAERAGSVLEFETRLAGLHLKGRGAARRRAHAQPLHARRAGHARPGALAGEPSERARARAPPRA